MFCVAATAFNTILVVYKVQGIAYFSVLHKNQEVASEVEYITVELLCEHGEMFDNIYNIFVQ